ncbi:MAG: TolC family protein [Firmicutes bacterium]|nr:TolC family protein [Bacillota bacterium]
MNLSQNGRRLSRRVFWVCSIVWVVFSLFWSLSVFASNEPTNKEDALCTYTLEDVVLAGLKENQLLRLAALDVNQASAKLEEKRGVAELQGLIEPIFGGGTLGRLNRAETALKASDEGRRLWETADHELAWESGVQLRFNKVVVSGGKFDLSLEWSGAGGVGDGMLADELYSADVTSEMTWTQPLFGEPALESPWWDIARAKDALNQTKLSRDSATQTAIIAITTLFFNVVEAQEKLDVALQAQEAILEQARVLESKVSRGMGGVLELRAMDIEVALARNAVSQNRRRLDLAKRELSLATGLNIGVMCRLLPPPPITYDGTLDSTVARALSDNAEIQAMTIDINAAQQAWKKAEQDSKPKFSTSVSINDAGAWRVGLDVGYSFWDGHAAKKRGEAAALELQKSMIRLENATENIKLDVRRRYYEYLDSEEKVELVNLRLMQAEELLEATRRRYGLRMATELEMMDVLNRLREAKAERAAAGHVRTLAAIQLLARTDQLIRIFPNLIWGKDT